IVDDDPAHVELVQRMVERAGYEAIVAQDVASALKTYEKQAASIDLVITDVVMSNNDGEALVRKLLAPHPNVRILLSTGLHSWGAAKRSISFLLGAYLVRGGGVCFVGKKGFC